MRILIVVLAFVSVALGACSSGGESDQTKALKATMVYFGDDPETFMPPVGSEYECAINPVTVQGATPGLPVKGTCRWDIQQQADVWHVTFAEEWSCADFNRDVPGYPLCSGEKGSHTWEWFVSETFQVGPLGDSGNFAPDMPQ